MAGRSVSRFVRTYIGGYHLSGDMVSLGQASHEFAEVDMTGMSDQVTGFLPGLPSASLAGIQGFLDNSANHLHARMSAASGPQIVSVAVGIQAAPAAGDPVFVVNPEAIKYQGQESSGGIRVAIELSKRSARGTANPYHEPWGVILDPGSAARTAVNGSTGVDDFGASTAFGGYQVAQILAGNGTATIKTQHASTNLSGSFADLAGATTGSIDCSTPSAIINPTTSRFATVERYLRWQIVLGTATSVTFLLSFVRAHS